MDGFDECKEYGRNTIIDGHLKLLVQEAGADVKSKNRSGVTPLTWAAANALAIMKVLGQEAGA